MDLYYERQNRQEQLFKEQDELEKVLDEINEKLATLKPADKEYWDLQKQWCEVMTKYTQITDEMMDICRELLAENDRLEDEIKEKHQKLEESGFFDKLNKTSDVLDDPDAYTDEEVKDAQEFKNGLNKAFREYVEENPDGMI